MDKTTKLPLAVIALGLWLNAFVPLLRPARTVKASESFKCTGDLKANAWGGTEASIGGYRVDISCQE
jgi:hypothetical protein